MTKNDIKKLRDWVECGEFENTINLLSDEDLNSQILQAFSSNELINSIDEKCELNSMIYDYVDNNLDAIIKHIVKKSGKKSLILSLLDLIKFASDEDIVEQIKTLQK